MALSVWSALVFQCGDGFGAELHRMAVMTPHCQCLDHLEQIHSLRWKKGVLSRCYGERAAEG